MGGSSADVRGRLEDGGWLPMPVAITCGRQGFEPAVAAHFQAGVLSSAAPGDAYPG